MREERNFLVTQLNTTNKINIFSFLPSTKVLLIIITLPNHIYIYIYSAIRLKIRRVPRKTFEAEPLFRETRSGQEEHWQGKTYRLSRIRSCSYLMARSREPQADGYNGIVCTQKTERYYSERERERASPLVFSTRFRFAALVPIPLFPRNSLPSSERLRSYLHKRYLPTASADRKKNTIHEITHALNEASDL